MAAASFFTALKAVKKIQRTACLCRQAGPTLVVTPKNKQNPHPPPSLPKGYQNFTQPAFTARRNDYLAKP